MLKDDLIAALIERVAGATGPDREIDADIVRTLAPGATVGPYIADMGDHYVFHAQALGISNKQECPAYTSSVDAALGLADQLSPIGPMVSHELSHGLARDGEEWWNFRIKHYNAADEGEPPIVYWATAYTAPLAIILATLRALKTLSGDSHG